MPISERSLRHACLRVLAVVAALPGLAHAQTIAAPFALLGPKAIATGTADPAAQRIIARASAARDRPPAPLPRLHTEGTLPGQGIRDASLAAKRDHTIALDFALAWRLTGDARYRDTAARYLDAWISVYQPAFNPIDETGFDQLILATDLTAEALPGELRERLAAYWHGMAEGYLGAMERGARNGTGNWQSHRVKLATLAAFASGDGALIGRARQAYRRQIAANIRPDGEVIDFAARDALHYVTYDLDPLLMAALAARAHGEDWYGWTSESGAGLPRALHWLEPYARGTATHIEFARTTVQFDRDRAAAGDAEYAPHPWDRSNAVATYARAALCDPAWRALLAELVQQTGRAPSDWITLVAHL